MIACALLENTTFSLFVEPSPYSKRNRKKNSFPNPTHKCERKILKHRFSCERSKIKIYTIHSRALIVYNRISNELEIRGKWIVINTLRVIFLRWCLQKIYMLYNFHLRFQKKEEEEEKSKKISHRKIAESFTFHRCRTFCVFFSCVTCTHRLLMSQCNIEWYSVSSVPLLGDCEQCSELCTCTF